MTDNKKILIAGCAAGATAATVPAVYGFVKATSRKPIDDCDFLRAENGGFISECGEEVILRGMNLNDELFWFKKAELSPDAHCYDVFDALEKRFGRYGAVQLIKKRNENFITVSDIKKLASMGANCVRIPLRFRYLFTKDNCKGDIDFDYLDRIVKNCRKEGIYVIFELHSAPGFQNTDSACSSNEKSVLFSSGTDGFEARNATIRIWAQVAAHYKDESAVAAYDLLNRPLNRMTDWEKNLDTLHKFYKRLCKAIRTVDEKHVIITEAAGAPHTLPDPDKLGCKNIAYGIYSHFHTTFELQSLINSINELRSSGIPFVICKLRSEENLDYTLDMINDNGISFLMGDYKGSGLKAAYLYGGSVPEADLDIDTYDEITEKWSKPLATKNFEKNKEMAACLKKAFNNKTICREKAEDSSKPKFKVKVGTSVHFGK